MNSRRSPAAQRTSARGSSTCRQRSSNTRSARSARSSPCSRINSTRANSPSSRPQSGSPRASPRRIRTLVWSRRSPTSPSDRLRPCSTARATRCAEPRPSSAPTTHSKQGATMPPSRQRDQSAPKPSGPAGTATGAASQPDPRAQSGRYLTTAQGVRLPDTDHSLKAGDRGPDAAGGLPSAREDHPLRPRADPGAGGARARRGRPRRLRVLRHRRVGDQGRLPGREGQEDRGLLPLLDRARLARLGRHRPRHPRLRGEVLHRRGQLRPGRQQHAGVLHPGRHQVPRHHPRRQAASRTARSRRPSRRTTRSGTSCRCTPRPPTTCSGT